MPDVAGSRSGVRQRRAREAALAVAPDLGVDARHATILEDWNNTIIRLAPAQIVAKVGTSHFRDARLESLERELAVAKHLAARNAPVVRPTEDVPAGPHRRHGLTLTLWQYVVPVPGAAGHTRGDGGGDQDRARGPHRLRRSAPQLHRRARRR